MQNNVIPELLDPDEDVWAFDGELDGLQELLNKRKDQVFILQIIEMIKVFDCGGNSGLLMVKMNPSDNDKFIVSCDNAEHVPGANDILKSGIEILFENTWERISGKGLICDVILSFPEGLSVACCEDLMKKGFDEEALAKREAFLLKKNRVMYPKESNLSI